MRDDCLEYLNLTIEEAAEGLGATIEEVYGLVSCQIGVSTEMAIRLSKAFGSTPETWLGMQMSLRPLAGSRIRRETGSDSPGSSGSVTAEQNALIVRIISRPSR